MSAVGISDINNLCGCLEFSNEATKNKIQPIISLDLQFQIFLPNEDFHYAFIYFNELKHQIGWKIENHVKIRMQLL